MSDSNSRSQRTEITKAFAKTADVGKALARDGKSRVADIIAQRREMVAESHKVMAENQELIGSHQPIPAVKSYECVFLNDGGKIAGSVELTAADDAAVIVKARVTFATGLIHSYQIWDVGRLVLHERSRY